MPRLRVTLGALSLAPPSRASLCAGSDGALALGDALVANPAMRTLELGGNRHAMYARREKA